VLCWRGRSVENAGETALGIVGDGDEAEGDVAVFRPQVKQRFSSYAYSQDNGATG